MPVGGQAVIEGVMLQNGHRVAVAVRTPEGKIVVEPLRGQVHSGRLTKIPFLRGPIRLYEMLALGLRALNVSARLAYGEEAAGSRWDFLLTVALAVVLVGGGFVALPVYLTGLMHIENPVLFNLAEGGIRVLFFLLYLYGISFMRDIRRVFQYHGAEHKVVHAYEAGEPRLEVARHKSPLHPRCGTAFLLLFIVISILVFSVIVSDSIWLKILGRLALLPVVAGIAYEVLMVGGRHPKAWWLRPFLLPGLWLQRLTTREPADDQLEVALAALRYVTEESSESLSTTS
ncbi:DUF1385 domain-containing protein [Candidatus Bipolaricaulota bacterium]|nr:DUF1385 domain-containing protein [Candidatus Bipolaricaulota bacterium]